MATDLLEGDRRRPELGHQLDEVDAQRSTFVGLGGEERTPFAIFCKIPEPGTGPVANDVLSRDQPARRSRVAMAVRIVVSASDSELSALGRPDHR